MVNAEVLYCGFVHSMQRMTQPCVPGILKGLGFACRCFNKPNTAALSRPFFFALASRQHSESCIAKA